MNSRFIFLFLVALGVATFSTGALAQDSAETEEVVTSSFTQGASLSRGAKTLRAVLMSNEATGEIRTPRFAAALRKLSWDSGESDGLTLTPEQEHWIVKWTKRPAGSATILLEFDSRPLLLEEIYPSKAASDGSFMLAAHMATVSGEKVRYEPQMHKNTVGYWTGKQDSATWHFQVEKPGKFNVAILQGCGKGQGGSIAQLECRQSGKEKISASIEFEVLETGHFQNFQWRHIGTIEIAQADVYALTILPSTIQKAALMDVRAISLVRMPD